MKRIDDPAALERCFLALEHAAVNGLRCPQNDYVVAERHRQGVHADLVGVLAREGFIKVEIFAQNWRVVTMLKGEHQGKQTKPPPYYMRYPYQVIDRDGSRRVAG